MLYADEPITRISEDSLNRRQFVEQLARAIAAWQLRQPLVIGVYGHWGDGKSSTLHMLKEQLSSTCLVIDFDPWYFNSQEDLIRVFFGHVFKIVSGKLPWFARVKLQADAGRMAKAVTSLPVSFGVPGFFQVALGKSAGGLPSPVDQKSELVKRLKEREKHDHRKVVVLVDNLDRLTADEMLLILKLIRLCSDFEGFVYVLAFDEKYVIRVIDQHLGSQGAAHTGEEYLKKIVQMDVQLPAIHQSSVDAFVDRAFDGLKEAYHIDWGADFEKRFPQFYVDHLQGKVIRNLRDAKKLANAVAFSLPLVKQEVNYADWVVLESLRVFSPNDYTLCQDNIRLLVPDHIVSANLWTDRERKELNEKFETLQKAVNANQKDFTLGVLEFLFPTFTAWRQSPARPGFPSPNDYEEYTRRQRIASPDYRDTYFQFGPEPGRLPDSEITRFIDDMNSAKDADRSSLITHKIIEMKRDGQLKVFTDKLILRADRINRNVDIQLVETLSAQSSLYSRDSSWPKQSEEDRIQALIYAVAAQNTQGDQAQRILESAIDASRDDAFAVRLVYYCAPERNGIIQRFDLIDQDMLHDKLRTRLRKHYVEDKSDIFDIEPGRYGHILSLWSGPLLNDRAQVQQYLAELFHSTPRYVGKFAAVFLTRTRSFEVNDVRRLWAFDLEDYRSAFDVDWLRSLLTELPGPLYETEREQWAIESFTAATREQGNPPA